MVAGVCCPPSSITQPRRVPLPSADGADLYGAGALRHPEDDVVRDDGRRASRGAVFWLKHTQFPGCKADPLRCATRPACVSRFAVPLRSSHLVSWAPDDMVGEDACPHSVSAGDDRSALGSRRCVVLNWWLFSEFRRICPTLPSSRAPAGITGTRRIGEGARVGVLRARVSLPPLHPLSLEGAHSTATLSLWLPPIRPRPSSPHARHAHRRRLAAGLLRVQTRTRRL